MLSTDTISTVNAEDGFDAWHQVTCRNFSMSECRREPDQTFRAQVSSRPFGALALSNASSLASDGIRMSRGHTEIRKDPRDHFMLYLVLKGRIDLSQDDRQASAIPGDLFLYDQAMPFTLDFHHHHAILVNIPRPMLVSRMPKVRRFTGRCIAGSSRLGALAGSVVRQMADFEASTKVETVDRLVASALDIVATTLEAELADSTEIKAQCHRLLPQVKGYILAHLHDAQLDLETIARAQNMAPRTLNRVFAAEGCTPIRWLWQQRLAASFKALSEGGVDNVTDAALGSGFTDLSHFSRAFKREFGLLPHAVQRGLRIGQR